ncbi:hypothetical protein [Thermosulfuriphilus sp.]
MTIPLELLAFSTHPKDLNLFETGELERILHDFGLRGLELLPLGKIPQGLPKLIVGVHLPFQPVWLPFWLEDRNYLENIFPGRKHLGRFFGGVTRGDFVSRIQNWAKEALKLKPRYLVFHAAHCGLEEVFSFRHRYGKKTVLEEVAILVNEALSDLIKATRVPLFFENLWWPGLTLLEDWEVKFLFSQVDIPQKLLGIMLDTGHLLNTKGGFTDEKEAIFWLLGLLKRLAPETKALIRGIHLHLSLSPSELWRPDKAGLKKLLALKDPLKRYQLARKRVALLDQHRAFSHQATTKILDLVNPDYIVHELRYNHKEELYQGLSRQIIALKGGLGKKHP